MARRRAEHGFSRPATDVRPQPTGKSLENTAFSPKARDAGHGHATLYLGTTQVVGIHVRADDLFCLRPHRRGGLFKDIAVQFDDGWGAWQSLGRLTATMKAIRAHVAAAIAVAPASRQLEGRYQAALAKTTQRSGARLRKKLRGFERRKFRRFPSDGDLSPRRNTTSSDTRGHAR